ncbi:tryptophanyl-tRNA synthetase [Thalassoporum mexicanum PCC 7367]|uniref:tryptophan--tRNA ligase n=1 Tax=Thalassoporum mexicanum TaxID=3457544 RepID=UPI00029FC2FB|nr:tryptophan--tRNA ligase [Pseudanabaena sp. PCC 7367]AFY68323.1 tryptophanyl-tRNA synthetase [Pseudanabaena sp. PCC 7367]
MAQKKRVLSGVQPTGNLHLGNYLGAIRNWVEMQADYDSFFFAADLHTITVPHDPENLAENTRRMVATYIACGIDPVETTLFVQSHISAHAELTWLLNCITPLNWLERMIQFKEKALKQGENVSVGLLDYPVLMAVDILLYQADLVPVGEDQKQHLELTRDIAIRFNDKFRYADGKKEAKAKDLKTKGDRNGDNSEAAIGRVFKLPDPLIKKEGARVMSLSDGTSKMSKSDPSDMSRINLLDHPDLIAKKIKKCKTDPIRGLEFDNPDRPECHNLLTLYMLLGNKTRAGVENEIGSMRGWGDFKPRLTETTIEALRPIQAKYNELISEPDYLAKILADGREKAGAVAFETLYQAKSALGFLAK